MEKFCVQESLYCMSGIVYILIKEEKQSVF